MSEATATRSSWIRLLFTVRGSSSRGVALRVLGFGAIACLVVLADAFGAKVHLPAGVHEATGAVAALVLTFRTNAAYSRFWEARTLWGSIVNASRNLTNLARSHVADIGPAIPFVTWIVVFAWVTRRRLRKETTWPEIESLLGEDESDRLGAAPHPSTYVAGHLSATVAGWAKEDRLSPMLVAQAQQLVASLVDALGGSERIAGTPIPLGHAVLIERFLVLYLATIPFMLVTRIEALAPIATMAIAYPLLLLDALATELESPFGHEPSHLPLTRICTRLQAELLGTAPVAEAIAEPSDLDPRQVS